MFGLSSCESQQIEDHPHTQCRQLMQHKRWGGSVCHILRNPLISGGVFAVNDPQGSPIVWHILGHIYWQMWGGQNCFQKESLKIGLVGIELSIGSCRSHFRFLLQNLHILTFFCGCNFTPFFQFGVICLGALQEHYFPCSPNFENCLFALAVEGREVTSHDLFFFHIAFFNLLSVDKFVVLVF